MFYLNSFKTKESLGALIFFIKLWGRQGCRQKIFQVGGNKNRASSNYKKWKNS